MRRTIFITLLCVLTACGSNDGNNGESGQSETMTQGEETMMDKNGERPLASVDPEDRANYYNSPPEMMIDENKKYVATIKTNKGDIVVELDPLYAPQHVNNFVFLAKQGFYDGLTFHRHVPGFVIQGGDPQGTGTGGPGYRIPAEIGLQHNEGAIAMARQGDQVNPERKSSGSQFYITLAPTHNLDGQYSVFGQVTKGFEDVVMTITKGDTIQRVEIEEK